MSKGNRVIDSKGLIIIVSTIILAFLATGCSQDVIKYQCTNNVIVSSPELCPQASLNYTEQDYGTLQDKYKNLKETVNELKTNIENQQDWLEFNSNLGNSSIEYKVSKHIITSCSYSRGNTCYIYLACPTFLNQRFLGLEYKTDLETTGDEDKLISLSEFSENGGGDCEDYSLFYNAELSNLIQSCKLRNDSITYVGYSDKPGSPTITMNGGWSDSVDITPAGDWVIGGAQKIVLNGTHDKPIMLCGQIMDLNTNEINGHCLIGLTNETIKSGNDVVKLKGTYLIEPQSGEYIGKIGDTKTPNILSVKNIAYAKNFISSIITNETQLNYDNKMMDWISLKDMEVTLSQISVNIDNNMNISLN